MWPGTANISADPIFVNAAAGDYRLGTGSPASGTGLGNVDMGVQFPVGGIPPAPFNLTANPPSTNDVQLAWEEDADNESGFEIERSNDGAVWQPLATVGPNVTGYTDATAAMDESYLYRVRAINSSGHSQFSNRAGATRMLPTVVVGGTLATDTQWSPTNGMVLVESAVTVPSGITLTITAGTMIKLTNDAGIHATAGGVIDIQGTAEAPVFFQAANDGEVWGGITAAGPGASLTIRHADIKAGQVLATAGAAMLLEDSYIHEYKNGTERIAGCDHATSVIVRRCHFNIYHETLWQYTLMLIEDSLFENANNVNSDALDFDGAVAGSIIRRCTFRHGPQSNTDAIDLGSDTQPMLIEDCLMFDFPDDKGVSIGETTYEITIRNCLMYGLDSGVAVKDGCTAIINNCTIVNNDYGFRNYNKANPGSATGGGHITNSWDNILWNNNVNVSLQNSSTLIADHSDLQGSVWPGEGNLDTDPQFLDATQRDYRLASSSPCIGTGRDGGNMGCHFPVGAPMAPSHPTIQSLAVEGGTATIRFWADSEKSYLLEASDEVSGSVWNTVTNLPAPPLPQLISVPDSMTSGHRFYRLSTP